MALTVTLRPLTRADFPLLQHWLAQPHVKRWWDHEFTAQAVEADFGACVDGLEPTDLYVGMLGDEPVGLIQRYAIASYPEYVEELLPVVDLPAGAFSVDYFIGEPRHLRQGLGEAMIRECVASIWRDFPEAGSVIVPVNASNPASWRVLVCAGFRRVAEGDLTPDNPIDARLHWIYRADRAQP
jgi:aminoglycoside 6'-N-acetyltransferase